MSSYRRQSDWHRLNKIQQVKKDSKKQYDSLLSGLPTEILTPDRENELAEKIQASQDEDAINELVLHNMRDAFFYALACSRTLLADTVYSLCYAALRYSATNFQPRRIRFVAFSKPYIRGEIYKTFEERKVVKNAETVSLVLENAEIDTPSSDATREVMDLYHKASCVDSDIHGIMIRDEWERIRPIFIEKLSEKERMVLELKYEGGFNFRQIGDLLRVSRSDTQATHTRALRKVRCVLLRKKELFNRH